MEIQRKALFLDRDGIINVDHGYVHTQEGFEFIQGIFTLVRHFVSKGYQIFVVTNQSGIGRGYYNQAQFHTLTTWMIERFQSESIYIEKVTFCPHLPSEGCHCRKPRTGMIEEITQSYPLDLKSSYFIGDKQSDMDLAREAGIGQSIAISLLPLADASMHFLTISACQEYLEENPDKIL